MMHTRRLSLSLVTSIFLIATLFIANEAMTTGNVLAAPIRHAAQATHVSTSSEPAQYVNPFVGTAPGATDYGTGGGGGDNFPGADVPFGMVQWSPDTTEYQSGGYYYPGSHIKGFSLTHFSGAGCSAYGDIPFMPYVGAVTTSPAADPNQYVSTFSHANESASAGYYMVKLDSGAQTELTVTQRSGMGRFTYPTSKPATMLINVSGSANGNSDAQATINNNSSTVSGWATSGNFCGAGNTYRVYFSAQFDHRFQSFGSWHNGSVTPGSTTVKGSHAVTPPHPKKTANTTAVKASSVTVSGTGSGVYATFDTSKSSVVQVKVGLSFVSVANAKQNLNTENTGKSFDQLHQQARANWNQWLGEVQVAGGTTADLTNFYTALYHALLHPNVFGDVNGQYIGFDGLVHTDRTHVQFANFSGWDIYRSEAQLLALLAPNEASDIAQSMVNDAAQGGSFDRWSQANGYTGVMVGDPYFAIIADMYAFGARKFDTSTALRLMIKGATQPTSGYVERPGLNDYMRLGYVPDGTGGVWGPTATTLEYTTADFSLAQFAQGLGDTGTYTTFMSRAQYWENLFNPANGYIQPRNRDGSFVTPFDPSSMNSYVEGNGAQYTWMVPYDLRGLFNAMGGNDKVVSRLDNFFTQLNAGPNQPYAFLGNEPTLETPWEYNYAGAPWKTQKVVRQAVNQLYQPTPGGYVGNDDLGEMSSWYVWAAMGLYPEAPARSELVLASPLFTGITVKRPSGQTIQINAPQASDSTPYVQSLKVNGQSSTQSWLPASFVSAGGQLDFTLGAAPNTTWGSAPSDAPPSFRTGEIPTRPYLNPGRVAVAPGGSSSQATIGAQNISGNATTVSWSAVAPTGLTVVPASGSFTVPAGGSGGQSFIVTAAASTPEGYYSIPFSSQTSDGTVLPKVTLQVVVAKPGSMLALYNNTGISDDSNQASANFDDVGFSYSEQALTATGYGPGATVTANGMTYSWPNVPAGEPDNIAVSGQTIQTPNAKAGASKLSFLGSATNGPSVGTATITYTDGSTQTAQLGFSDWTLGAGGGALSYNNVVATSTPYRNSTSGSSQQVVTYIFATATVQLDTSKHVASITLPGSVNQGTLHIFTMAIA